MRFLSSLLLVASATLAAARTAPGGPPTSFDIPGSYIVVLKEGAVLGRRSLDSHAHFVEHMKRSDLASKITKTFTSSIFQGAEVNGVSETDLATILASEGVESVIPNRIVPAPSPVARAAIIGANATAENPTDTFSTHQMTGVDKLHNMGIYGKGVRVSVIDTGIDYTHPALGNGCFGAGCKVTKGYDFVGDAFTGSGALVPDSDPMDCAGHGTHVSGIIAADYNPLNFTGVAPQATLQGYRVFGCTGNTQSSIIIDALLKAYTDGTDVVSISIGGGSAWPEDAYSMVFTRLVAQGIVISVSNGNSGDSGLWYTAAPAIARGVIAVSSIQNIVTPAKAAILSNGLGPYFLTGDIELPESYEIAVSNFDTTVTDDGCTAYTAGSMTGKVALIKRGTCSFSIKAQNALDAGAVALLLYNNVPGAAGVSADLGGVVIPEAGLTFEDGVAIAAAVAAEPAVTISFPTTYYNSVNAIDAGLVSDFTSYGLTADAYIKPQIGAPGGNILSTYPVAKGSYAVLSGTSMAAPFISGVAALFIQHNGVPSDTTEIQTILQNSATPLAATLGGTQLNTVVQQGAGLVNAYASVVGFKTIITPSEFSLNDTEHALTSTKITLTNVGTASQSYKLSNLPAAAALTFGETGELVNRDVPLVDGSATVTFGSTFVTIPAGGVVDVALTFAAPTSLSAADVPIYSGWVVVESADLVEHYVVPYAGVAASMRLDYPVIAKTPEYSPVLVSAAGENIEGPATITGGGLSIYYVLLASSRKVFVDLVPATTTFTPTITKRSSASFSESKMNRVSRRQSTTPDIVGNLSTENLAYRNDPLGLASDGNQYAYFSITNSATSFLFADGTPVPNGDYKVLLRALKLSSLDEYESWLSPVITVAN